MNRHVITAAHVSCVAAAVGAPRAAAGAEPVAPGGSSRCDVVVVAAGDRALGRAWQDAVRALQARLAAMPDCLAATLTVTPVGPAAQITAEARRSGGNERATRFVAEPEKLAAVATGLLASIPVDTTAREVTPPEARGPLLPPAAAAHTEAPASPRAVAPATKLPAPAPARRVVLAAEAGLRASGPARLLALDLAFRGDALFDGWLVSAMAGYAPLALSADGAANGSYTFHEVQVGVAAGRRFPLGDVPGNIDLTLGPTLAWVTEQGTDADGDATFGGTAAQVRVTAAARTTFLAGRYHPSLTVEAFLVPAELVASSRIDDDLAALPAWGVSIRAGFASDFP